MSDRLLNPYPSDSPLLPFCSKIYPIVQTAPEIGFRGPGHWPPSIRERVAQWRNATGGRPPDGNQIYIHIPFCPINCHLCPLFKLRSSRDKSARSREVYLRALVRPPITLRLEGTPAE